MRDNKGKRWEKHFNDYTVIDIETCGLFGDDRNSIIELSAIRVRNGLVVDEFSSLVNPKRLIPSSAIAINGIDNSMVAGAPLVESVLSSFLDFIGNDIIVGYNINTFDYNIIYDLSASLFNRVFSNDFVDVFYAARRVVCDVKNYELTSICERFSIDHTGAHRALKDCYLTKTVYDIISSEFGETAFDGKAHSVNGGCEKTRKEPRYSEETQQLRELQSILFQIIEDGVVTEDEVTDLVEWMEHNSYLRGNYPFDRVYDVLEKVLEDGIVDKEELKLLLDKFTEFTSPVKTTCNDVNDIQDKHFVLTGEFRYGSRSAVSDYIVSKGGIVDDQVKKCTQFVVIGSLGSQAWKNGVYGSKIKKAIELKDKGQSIELIAEEDFFSAQILAEDNDETVDVADENDYLDDLDIGYIDQGFVDANQNWKDTISECLDKVISEEELPEQSLVLFENFSEKSNRITSYSISVKKPDYPRGINTSGVAKTSLFNIQFRINRTGELLSLIFCIPDELAPRLVQRGYNVTIYKRKSDAFTRVMINPDSEDLKDFSLFVIRELLDSFFLAGGSAFGCCSRYEKCSDAKKCLHDNRLYALGCAYYHSLREGRIFYGKNRNV